jgi:prevent-host-death family protein
MEVAMGRSDQVVRIVTATEAQNRFGALLKRAYAAAEHLIIERDGIPVAALIPIADYQRLAIGPRDPQAAQRVFAAGDRERAVRDLSAFLQQVHARLPEVPEDEGKRIIDRSVSDVRRNRRRSRR